MGGTLAGKSALVDAQGKFKKPQAEIDDEDIAISLNDREGHAVKDSKKKSEGDYQTLSQDTTDSI